jgi:hypothetical protein
MGARSPRAFDRWLQNVRQHGYVRLLDGGARLKGEERDNARTQAERIFCQLLWMSYLLMARCYGALTLSIYLDFCLNGDLVPTLPEILLFRQLNFPQPYLAGLPLAFLPRAPFRWVGRGLLDVWHQELFAAEHYDIFTHLLGLHGALVRSRRAADRHRKAGRVGCYAVIKEPDDIPAKADEVTDREAPWLTSTACPRCGEPLEFARVEQRFDEARVLAEFHCRRCDKEDSFRVNLNDLRARQAP